ncbi:MAG: hypothetical protein JXA46_06730, partial [Dehalococcoidales bacterium]|nr:hypothetical protein [Dehalococcoidales bacterium]
MRRYLKQLLGFIAVLAILAGALGGSVPVAAGGVEWSVMNSASAETIENTPVFTACDALAGPAPQDSQDIIIDLRATGINGDIINVTDYTLPAGTVTEDGLTMDNQTAMGALVYYCQQNSIDINVQSGQYGLYVFQMGSDPSDENNWVFYVNQS